MSSIFIVSGPGGVGKGTLVRRLVERDPQLWLSRSWTTRPQRVGEADDSYEFVTAQQFQQRIDAGGFWEWVEFLGNRYGTPIPQPPAGQDVLLEIELKGAQMVRSFHPEAVLVLIVPPSEEEQKARLRTRGEDEARIAERVEEGRREMEKGANLASEVVVNDDLEHATQVLASIVEKYRSA